MYIVLPEKNDLTLKQNDVYKALFYSSFILIQYKVGNVA